MDFDKLSLKEQLELSILKIECYIKEDTIILNYFKRQLEHYQNKLKLEKRDSGKDIYRAAIISYESSVEIMEDRISEHKDKMYKVKDQLYNLKENENLVSPE